MSRGKSRAFHATGTVLLALLWVVSGCSERPTPVQSSSSKRYAPVVRLAHGKLAAADQWVEATRTITPEAGGAIEVGDDIIGKSSLAVPPGAVSAPVNISMRATTSGPVVVEFGPELQFAKPVTVSISYLGADLTRVDEASLTVLYNDEILEEWELVTSTVNLNSKAVVGYLRHFSEYAVGSEH